MPCLQFVAQIRGHVQRLASAFVWPGTKSTSLLASSNEEMNAGKVAMLLVRKGCRMTRSTLTMGYGILLVSALAGAVNGQQTQPAPQPAKYSNGDINLSASRVYAHVFKKTAIGHEHAIVGRIKQGHIEFSDDQARGEIVFDMTSFDADSDEARKFLHLEGSTDAGTRKQVNANMLGPTVLDVETHPTAVFKITDGSRTDKTSRRGLPQYQLEGKFTLHGRTQAVSVLAEVNEIKGWTHLLGGFRIKQTDFGITPFTKAFGTIGVADELLIYGDLYVAGSMDRLSQAVKQPAVQR